MIGLLLATMSEAGALLERLAARKLTNDPFETYGFGPAGGQPGGVVVISGMGKQAAARATEYLIAQRGATIVINVGVCGALREDLPRGQVLRIDAALDGDRALSDEMPEALPCRAAAWGSLPTGCLATVGEPVYEQDRREQLSQSADMVDMEGAAVAQTCRAHGVEVCLLKGVTDYADDAGKEDIRRHIASVSDRLADEVLRGLIHLRRDDGSILSKILRFAKIEHSLFSLPLLFAGAYLGAGRTWPSLRVLGLIALAGVGARTLGMAMNRVLDRDLDALNRRTAGRELPGGGLSPAAGIAVAVAGMAVYLLACAGLGRLCLLLSPVPAVPLVLYSLLKRFTSLCHFGIGLCLALAPLGAFIAAAGNLSFGADALALAAFAFCWISGFDIIYALQDVESDRETGVHSIPTWLGSRGGQWVAAAVHGAAAVALVVLWRFAGGGAIAGALLAVAVLSLAMAYWPRIPLPARFFPLSAVAGVAASLIPLVGGL